MAGEQLFDEEFKEDLLFNLNELRESKILCDTTIRAEGTDFAAHRCVLTAASEYFRALFTTDFKENETNVVELKSITSDAMNEVLQFMYTGEAKADSSNAQDLVMAADYFMLPNLKSIASELLEGTISESNCLELESFASQFNCELLKQAAVAYKVNNFATVVASDDFKSLDLENVKDLISRDEIFVSKEEDVYEAVILWVKHDLSSRECLLPELLNCVRAFSMSKYSLREILKSEELVVKSPACTSILLQGLDNFLFPDNPQVLFQRPRLCLKSKELAVVLTGGHENCAEDPQPCSDVFGLVLSTMKWLALPIMPYPRTRHAAAVCGGQLFVVGGNPDASVCYYNPRQNKWSKKGKLHSRSHCSLTTYNEEIFMIGGRDDNWDAKRSVKKYDGKVNEWRKLPSMKFPRVAHCAVVLENLIYVLAGSNGSVCLKSVECYNPSNDQWTQIPDMIKARRFAAAEAITGGRVIVIGGYSDMSFDTIETSCEIFDKNLNQWSLVSSPTVPRAACGIVSVGNCVYLFGGEDGNKELDSVECYVVDEDSWNLIGNMPRKRSCLQASLLQLPLCSEQNVNHI